MNTSLIKLICIFALFLWETSAWASGSVGVFNQIAQAPVTIYAAEYRLINTNKAAKNMGYTKDQAVRSSDIFTIEPGDVTYIPKPDFVDGTDRFMLWNTDPNQLQQFIAGNNGMMRGTWAGNLNSIKWNATGWLLYTNNTVGEVHVNDNANKGVYIGETTFDYDITNLFRTLWGQLWGYLSDGSQVTVYNTTDSGLFISEYEKKVLGHATLLPNHNLLVRPGQSLTFTRSKMDPGYLERYIVWDTAPDGRSIGSTYKDLDFRVLGLGFKFVSVPVNKVYVSRDIQGYFNGYNTTEWLAVTDGDRLVCRALALAGRKTAQAKAAKTALTDITIGLGATEHAALDVIFSALQPVVTGTLTQLENAVGNPVVVLGGAVRPAIVGLAKKTNISVQPATYVPEVLNGLKSLSQAANAYSTSSDPFQPDTFCGTSSTSPLIIDSALKSVAGQFKKLGVDALSILAGGSVSIDRTFSVQYGIYSGSVTLSKTVNISDLNKVLDGTLPSIQRSITVGIGVSTEKANLATESRGATFYPPQSSPSVWFDNFGLGVSASGFPAWPELSLNSGFTLFQDRVLIIPPPLTGFGVSATPADPFSQDVPVITVTFAPYYTWTPKFMQQ